MAYYDKPDMVYGDYEWKGAYKDSPYSIGRVDSAILNRHEGYEVLHMINKLVKLWDLEDRAACKKLERMIHDHLPSGVRSHDNVIEWIEDNWNHYE